MKIKKLFELDNIIPIVLYSVGLFGIHIALLLPALLHIPSRSVTIPFRAVILSISILVIFISIMRGVPGYRGKLWIAFSVFWGFYGLGILMEPWNLLMQTRMDYALFAYGVCAIPTCSFLVSTTRRDLHLGMRSFYLFAFLAGVLTITLYRGANLDGIGRAASGDFIGSFIALSPLTISYSGSALGVLGAYFLFVRESLSSLIYRCLIGTLFMVMGAYLIVLGASRGPVFAISIPILTLLVCRVKKSVHIFRLLVACFVLSSFAAMLFYFAETMGSSFSYRLNSLLYLKESYMSGGSGVGRIDIYRLAFQQFLENPIFGNGLYVRTTYGYPHNFILEAFLTTGVFGGTAFCVYFFTCVWRAIKIMRHFPAYSWASLFFLHYAVYCQLSSTIINNHYFWYSSAIVIAVDAFTSKERMFKGGPPKSGD